MLTGGDVMIINPGMAYKLNFDNGEDTEYYLINFDFVFDGQYRAAKTPVERKMFAGWLDSAFTFCYTGHKHIGRKVRP